VELIHSLEALRAKTTRMRLQAQRIALVPTMGNLHAGHLRLVEEAKRHADRVIVTIFVNPTQFGPGEDFERYPRTPEADVQALTLAGADILFMPEVGEVYPASLDALTMVEVPGLSEILCGAFRPGHFRGVATIVLKLLNMVGPDCALFGEKDFQQLAVIRRMVRDLNLPLMIHGVPTVRESSGLAMSSRNAYLNEAERQKATVLYSTLKESARSLLQDSALPREVEEKAASILVQEGFLVDYVAVRRVEDLQCPRQGDPALNLIVLAAARLGKTRLIDNLKVSDLP
jgi:pantoate--beta-alanine ligase